MKKIEFPIAWTILLLWFMPQTIFAHISIQDARNTASISDKDIAGYRTKNTESEIAPLSGKKKQIGHQANFEISLRRLDVDDYTYSQFNQQNIQNIQEKPINDISFDWGMAYYYRPASSYSFGLAFHRLQINTQSIDLRYSSTDPIPPAPGNLDPIASDLISDNLSIGQFYRPQSIFDRAYNYEAVARAYILPDNVSDPFLQATLGYTHHKSAVTRQDSSLYTSLHDQFWTWSIGTGCSIGLTQSLLFEPSLSVRNLHSFIYSDSIQSLDNTESYNYTVTASRYYSLDLHFSLITRW